MATKQEVLNFIGGLIKQNNITKDELIETYDSVMLSSDRKKNILSGIFYYVGGGIIFFGVVFLISQNWGALNFGIKLFVTLIIGIIFYMLGLLSDKAEKTRAISAPFYFISAMLLPLGLYVLCDNMGLNMSEYGSQSLIFFILVVIYSLSNFLFKKDLFLFFTIIFSTIFFFVITNFIAEGSSLIYKFDFYEYRTLFVGFIYILLGYGINKKHNSIAGFLYGFGIFGVLLSILLLTGFIGDKNLFLEITYPVVIFISYLLSVYLQRKSFLVWATIFLIFYIFKITGEYFAGSLGWPIALMIAGILIIFTTYFAFNLKNKYFKKNN